MKEYMREPYSLYKIGPMDTDFSYNNTDEDYARFMMKIMPDSCYSWKGMELTWSKVITSRKPHIKEPSMDQEEL